MRYSCDDMPKTNLRIVVFCLSMEIQKPLKAFEYYKPDRVYMLGMTKNKVYADFKKEIDKQMPDTFEYKYIETTSYDFKACLRDLLIILKKEKLAGNHVYIDIIGPPAYSAAAMVASMMEEAKPFFSGTKEYTVNEKQYYDGKKPIGMTKEAYDPWELPTFSIKRPEDKLVRGLAVWKEIYDKSGLMTDTRIIKALEGASLMEDIFDDRDRVTQKAKMQYRRQFLDRWLEKRWVESVGRGKYELTEYGKVAVEVFT